MRGRSYTKLRETTFDLYTENERLPWYYKALSNFSAWLVLAGYILFSIAFTASSDDLRISPSLVTGLAATGVFLGYVSDFALAFLSRSLIFTFDGVLMPVLTASAVGVFSTIVHRALHKSFDPGTTVYLILPLVASVTGTIVSAVLSWVVYRKLRKIKELDARRRTHVPMDHFTSPMLPQPTISREVHDMVPDDEQQRRQLMHLLMAKENRNQSLEDASSTYRIDLPWDTAEDNRQRSGSLPNTKTNTNRLSVFGGGRDRSNTSESFKDPRERRREQIEWSGVLASNTPNPAALSSTWHGSGSSPRYG